MSTCWASSFCFSVASKWSGVTPEEAWLVEASASVRALMVPAGAGSAVLACAVEETRRDETRRGVEGGGGGIDGRTSYQMGIFLANRGWLIDRDRAMERDIIVQDGSADPRGE